MQWAEGGSLDDFIDARLGRRTHPVPLDPATWTVLQRCLDYRQQQQTQNPHVIVTRITRSGKTAVSAWYFGQLLAPAGVATRTLRAPAS